jgi:hypothetical protein
MSSYAQRMSSYALGFQDISLESHREPSAGQIPLWLSHAAAANFFERKEFSYAAVTNHS